MEDVHKTTAELAVEIEVVNELAGLWDTYTRWLDASSVLLQQGSLGHLKGIVQDSIPSMNNSRSGLQTAATSNQAKPST